MEFEKFQAHCLELGHPAATANIKIPGLPQQIYFNIGWYFQYALAHTNCIYQKLLRWQIVKELCWTIQRFIVWSSGRDYRLGTGYWVGIGVPGEKIRLVD